MILYPADMGRDGGADRVRVPGVNLEIYELVPNLFYLRDQCLDVDSRREDIRAPQIATNAVQLGHRSEAAAQDIGFPGGPILANSLQYSRMNLHDRLPWQRVSTKRRVKRDGPGGVGGLPGNSKATSRPVFGGLDRR